MKIKCINVGTFKSITLNWVYDVTNINADFYYIENDRGEERKYAKKYFEVYEEPVVAPPEPPKPPELKINVNFGNNIVILDYGDESESINIGCSETAGNCGVFDISGINNICESLEDLDLYNEDNILKVVDKIVEESPKTITIFSTNKDYPELWGVLDENCDFKSDELINANSGNPIKVWGFYKKE